MHITAPFPLDYWHHLKTPYLCKKHLDKLFKHCLFLAFVLIYPLPIASSVKADYCKIHLKSTAVLYWKISRGQQIQREISSFSANETSSFISFLKNQARSYIKAFFPPTQSSNNNKISLYCWVTVIPGNKFLIWLKLTVVGKDSEVQVWVMKKLLGHP